MAVQKSRVSPSQRGMRRAHDALSAKQLSTDPTTRRDAPAPPRDRRRLLPRQEGHRARRAASSKRIDPAPGMPPRLPTPRGGSREAGPLRPRRLRSTWPRTHGHRDQHRGMTQQVFARIAGTGSYLPEKVLTNDDLREVRRHQRRMDRRAHRHPRTPHRRRRRNHRRPRLPRRRACAGSRRRRAVGARPDRARHDDAGPHLPVDRVPGAASPRRRTAARRSTSMRRARASSMH